MTKLWHHNFCEIADFHCPNAFRIRTASAREPICLLACSSLDVGPVPIDVIVGNSTGVFPPVAVSKSLCYIMCVIIVALTYSVQCTCSLVLLINSR